MPWHSKYFLKFEYICMIEKPKGLLLIGKQRFGSLVVDSRKIYIFDGHGGIGKRVKSLEN